MACSCVCSVIFLGFLNDLGLLEVVSILYLYIYLGIDMCNNLNILYC